jgi:FHA domain
MGTLDCKTMNKRVPLRARCMLGRAASCDVPIDSPKVSSEHAVLRWTNAAWELRDLGSRNGTFLEGRRLETGERATLDAGATFSLARSGPVFELVDASPAGAAVLHRESGMWHVAEDGILALPSGERPEVVIFSSSNGVWHVETEEQSRPAVNGETIPIGRESFLVEVPAPSVETLQSNTHAPLLESIGLRFTVTPDEEDVEMTVIIDGQPHPLTPRRYHYLLVTLARAWLADEGAPNSVRGWVERDELCKKLEMDVNKLNVEIYRARKQLAELSVQGAARLIERRFGTREIRIGVTHIEVMRR